MDHGGELGIELSARDGTVALRVADNGRGMSPEMLEHAFELFYSTRPAEEGSPARAAGLGLAVSQRLIERCGGRIDIESTPGHGTTVSVSLPVAPVLMEGGGAGDGSLDTAKTEQAARGSAPLIG